MLQLKLLACPLVASASRPSPPPGFANEFAAETGGAPSAESPAAAENRASSSTAAPASSFSSSSSSPAAEQQQQQSSRPRFYIMRLPGRGLGFHRITYHRRVTQCLGALGHQPWYLAVHRPSFTPGDPAVGRPDPSHLRAFRIPPGVFVKLERGTWHAGPLFGEAGGAPMDFYNLELSDTNVRVRAGQSLHLFLFLSCPRGGGG